MKRTNRLLSGSESHCSKSVSTKVRLDLSAREDTSGSCNKSTSNDAVSLMTSMLILSRNRISSHSRNETCWSELNLNRNRVRELDSISEWKKCAWDSCGFSRRNPRSFFNCWEIRINHRCWLRKWNRAAIWIKEKWMRLGNKFCRDPREFGGREKTNMCADTGKKN